MPVAEEQRLWELINWADVTIRAASQLRRLKAGGSLDDNEALTHALEFLERARDGGAFMAGQVSYLREPTLEPINWAAQAHLLLHPTATGIDYAAVKQCLDELIADLSAILTNPSQVARGAERLAQFLQALGDRLGARADQGLRTESRTLPLDL